MQRYSAIIFVILFVQFSFGQNIDIGVYRSHNIQQIDFRYLEGGYSVLVDKIPQENLKNGETISILKSGDKVTLKRNNQTVGIFKSVVLSPTGTENSLQLNPRSPNLKERNYYDGFTVRAESNGLKIINNVSYRHYLGGVIQSEGGYGQSIEYYKSQAVISRTYALKHINRHSKEGFNLCDQVHCQAYYNKVKSSQTIIDAVNETNGIYMVDTFTNELVESYFFANCGGETSMADYVWRQNLPYLKPVVDTFCVHTRQAKWVKRVPKQKWRDFLVKEYFYPIEDSLYAEIIYDFKQDERKAFYISPHLGIPLRDLRYKFGLKSTFFSCYSEGDDVIIEGRGFGHGVGLCQEGAMNMAKAGYDYKKIIQFYYSGVDFKQYLEDVFFAQQPKGEMNF
ncbi:MAG: SpoIID/LytB domain-containing protein [Brumimicrobium sp.]